jgi:hypothetical protein
LVRDWNVTLCHTLREGNLIEAKSNRISFLLANAMGIAFCGPNFPFTSENTFFQTKNSITFICKIKNEILFCKKFGNKAM